MNTVEIAELFEFLKNTKGSIAKKSFIKKQSNNKDFLEVLKFLMDPRVTTGVAKKKFDKVKVVGGSYRHFADLGDALNYIVENNTGSDRAIETIRVFIMNQPKETHEFLRSLFIKDYPCGVSAKTVNEALGYDLIFTHNVMLGHKYEDKMDTVKGKFFLTLKMDDNRATYIPGSSHENPSIFISRQGQIFEGLNELHEIMADLPSCFIYDGGLISANEDLPSKDRFRETGSILRKKGEKTGLQFVIYDIIPLEEWDNAIKPTMKYSERRTLLTSVLAANLSADELKLIQPVKKLYQGSDKEVIFPLLKEVIAKGHEGLMLNTADGVYEKKRGNSLLKIKEFYTADLRVIGYKEHTRGGKLGALIVDYKGNPTNIGFGFTDKQRDEFWENREEMIGKIIEVKYFQESQDQNGKLSIRHGGFERLRDDKEEVSYD